MGAALGPLLTGYIYDKTGSYHWAILMCAGASLTALVFALFIRSAAEAKIPALAKTVGEIS
jgi:cyanate permease